MLKLKLRKGTIILWSFWPSFVAGPAGEASRHMAMTNTYISLSASTIGVFIISGFTSGKTRLTLAHIQVATLAGGVVMSTPSGTDQWTALSVNRVCSIDS